MLAIGIGVNVAAFSLFNMVALEPLAGARSGLAGAAGAALAQILYERDAVSCRSVFYRDHAKTLSAVMAVLGVPPMQFDDDLQAGRALRL